MGITPLQDDLEILQKLEIPFFVEDVDVIQKLDDEPNDVGGLTSAKLKAKFDEGAGRIKRYLNEELIPQLSDTVAEAEVRRDEEAKRAANEEERQAAEAQRRETFGQVLQCAAQAKDAAEQAAAEAQQGESGASASAEDSEAWAAGARKGIPVGEDDPAYHNNAQYYKDRAKDIAGGQYDVLGSASAVEERLLPQIVSAEKLAKSQLGAEGGATGELEDLEVRLGIFPNAGAGWQTFRFPTPFEGTPVVCLQPVGFSGWCEIREITPEGFSYCLRQPVYTPGQLGEAGRVITGSYYTANQASTNAHTEHTLVSEVILPGQPTLPTAENKTTDAPVLIQWLAAEWNGEEGT